MISKRAFLSKYFASGRTGLFNSPSPPSGIRRTCHVSTRQIHNRDVFTLRPASGTCSGRHILYLHGGAYINSFVRFHWKFLAQLVTATGCTVTAPDYPLAPLHTCKDSFAMTDILYRQLLETVDPVNLILMGDSSGGGFALALAQKMVSESLPPPAQVILLSPWLDITLSNPRIKDVKGAVPFLGIDGLRQAGKKYAGDISPDHYLLSPVNGNLQGTGKISVFTGSRDILVADARKLYVLAGSKGIEMNYFEYEEMFHTWMFLNFPEAKKAKEQIFELVRQGE